MTDMTTTQTTQTERPYWYHPEHDTDPSNPFLKDGQCECQYCSYRRAHKAGYVFEKPADEMTVADLTEDHFGWYIKVESKDPVVRWRHFDLIGLRTWEYKGKTTVGLIVKDDNPCGRMETHCTPETKCVLIEPITAKAKRAAKAKVS